METLIIKIWSLIGLSVLLFSLGVLFGHVVCSIDQTQEAGWAIPRKYLLREFPVLEISAKDGDTFAVSLDLGFDLTVKQDLRLFGVDAPESSTEAGKLVTAVAKQWIKDRTCVVRFRKEDKYGGRFDGDLVGDDDEFSEFLLENKLAREYSGSKRPAWSPSELAAIAERAKKVLEQP